MIGTGGSLIIDNVDALEKEVVSIDSALVMRWLPVLQKRLHIACFV